MKVGTRARATMVKNYNYEAVTKKFAALLLKIEERLKKVLKSGGGGGTSIELDDELQLFKDKLVKSRSWERRSSDNVEL